MARYDTADLVKRLRAMTQRPDDDDTLTAEKCYGFLSDAGEDVVRRVAQTAPHLLMGPRTLMLTDDGGLTYYFGMDPDDAWVTPLGEVEVYADGTTARQLLPGRENDPRAGYVPYGDHIGFPVGQARAFADGAPYARYITPTCLIDATHEPSLPPILRPLLAPIAAQKWCVGQADPAPFELAEQKVWFGNPAAGDYGLLGALQRQVDRQGAQGEYAEDGGRWWDGISTGAGYGGPYPYN